MGMSLRCVRRRWTQPIVHLVMRQHLTNRHAAVEVVSRGFGTGDWFDLNANPSIIEAKVAYSSRVFLLSASTAHNASEHQRRQGG